MNADQNLLQLQLNVARSEFSCNEEALVAIARLEYAAVERCDPEMLRAARPQVLDAIAREELAAIFTTAMKVVAVEHAVKAARQFQPASHMSQWCPVTATRHVTLTGRGRGVN